MSEVRELVDEIKDRLSSWRRRSRVGQSVAAYEAADTITDVPEIEFTPLNPFEAPKPGMPRVFAELTPAWISAQCAPHIFAQGQQFVTRKQVARAVAHGGRLTGTTREREYEDQEILLQDGILTASCTCQRRGSVSSPAITSAPVNRDGSAMPAPIRTLACPHIVAVLLAYLQAPASMPINVSEKRPSAQASGKLVCPVTRQILVPNRPLFQCEHCGLCYSPEGWEFLRKEARGVCCNCNARNTVKEAASFLK